MSFEKNIYNAYRVEYLIYATYCKNIGCYGAVSEETLTNDEEKWMALMGLQETLKIKGKVGGLSVLQ